MGWQEGMRMGQSAYNSAMDQLQRERENKWVDEQRVRQRQEWADQDLSRQGAIDVRGRVSSSLDQFGTPVDAGQMLGIKPGQAQQPQMPEPQEQVSIQGPGRTPTSRPMQAPVDPTQQPQGLKRGQYSVDQAGMLRDQLAMAGNNPEAIAKIQANFGKLKMDSDAAAIKNYIINADPVHINELMGQVSADRRNTFEIKPSKTTGLYTVGEGSTKVDMSRAELAEWMSANHRLKNGDPTAMADMQKIDKDLAAKVEATYKRSNDSAALAEKNFAAGSGRISANASATSASASMKNANTNAAYKDEQVTDLKDARGRRQEAMDLQTQWDTLTPAEQTGERGLGLQRKFNMLNVKNGGTVNLSAPRTGANSGSAALKYQVDNMWNETEKKLREGNTPEPDIVRQREGFMAMRGFAPDMMVNTIFTGRDDKTGSKLSEADVDNFNRQFPNSQIDKAELPWLKGKPAAGITPQRKSSSQIPFDSRRNPIEQVTSRGSVGFKFNGKMYPDKAAAESAAGIK